jgi:putative ABC transport system permease protein
VSDDFARSLLSGAATTAIDGRVLLTAMAITLGTALFLGVAPALVLTRLDLRSSLGSSRSTTAGRHTARLRRGLAVAEVALAVVLVVGAGLLIRTFINLTSVDPGFNPAGIVIGRMSLQGTSLEEAARREVIFAQALDRIRRLPGVVTAAVANHVPVESGLNLALPPPPGALIDGPRSVDWRYVTPDYFAAFDIPTRAGRGFDERDNGSGKPVAMVNEAFARTYFGRLDIVGQTVRLDPSMKDPSREIVGIVGDVKARSNSGFTRGINALASPAAPAIFVPAAQAPDAAVRIAHAFFQMKWIVKTDTPLTTIERGMREALQAIDPTLPFVRFEPMSAVIADDLNLQRLLMTLLAAFASSAMLLAAVGLSGLVAYTAAQRTREMGVRMALGATGSSIVRLLVGEGLVIAGIGVALGAAGALFTSRVLATLLHGVTPLDAVTFVAATVILIGVAACAAFVPSLAAARTDPVTALRAE